MTLGRNKSNAEFDELLTVEELSALLKVSKNWIYQRIHSKTLPFPYIKVGHYPRFPVSGVKKFLEANTIHGS